VSIKDKRKKKTVEDIELRQGASILQYQSGSDGSKSKIFDQGWEGSIFCCLSWVWLGQPSLV